MALLMPDPCFNPQVFTPPTGHLLSSEQWHTVQAFSNRAAVMDVPALAARMATLLPSQAVQPVLRSEAPPTPYSPNPVWVNAGTLILQPLIDDAQQLHGDAIAFNAQVLAPAHALGIELANFGNEASTRLKAIAAMVDASQPDAAGIVGELAAMQTRANANAVDAEAVAHALDNYRAKASALVAAFAAGVDHADEALRPLWNEGAIDVVDRASFFVSGSLKPLGSDLVALSAAMQAGLDHVASAWNAIAMELEEVMRNAQLAGAAALKGQRCLAAVALTTAANEWLMVTADAELFVKGFYLAVGAT